MKDNKIWNSKEMKKKCCNNNMNNYWLKDIRPRKLLNISENVKIIIFKK